MPSPEELAREKIDALLQQCGWILQNKPPVQSLLLTISFKTTNAVVAEAILTDEKCSLLTLTAATESVSLCTPMKS